MHVFGQHVIRSSFFEAYWILLELEACNKCAKKYIYIYDNDLKEFERPLLELQSRGCEFVTTSDDLVTNHMLFRALNSAEPFDIFKRVESVFLAVGLDWHHLYSAVMNSLDDGKLPTWPPGGHPDGEEPKTLNTSHRFMVNTVTEKLRMTIYFIQYV